MKYQFSKLIATSALFLICAPAHTATPQKIGEYKDWTAYHFTENNGEVCYMVSQPKKATGNYNKRGDIFAVVTHRPAEKSENVFSYIAGYSYKPGSEVKVSIDKQNFTLFTQGDSAWATDSTTDAQITSAIRRGHALVVEGISSRGTKTVDTFGLSGSTAAYKAISKQCGIK